MGINRNDVELLIRLQQLKHIPLNPYVAEIGTQQMSNNLLSSVDVIRKAERAFGVSRPFAVATPRPSRLSAEGMELLDPGAPFARDFWLSLGFEYTAIDVDGSPGSIPLDLNYDQVPGALKNKYGLVTNLGTTEHVCNQMNAFKVIHDLTAPGGVMMHNLPAGGQFNHGLVNYNMKFFWLLARSNEYTWLYMNFHGGVHTYQMPENMVDFIKTYDPASSEKMRERQASDYSIRVAFKKSLDIPFVPPLDVESGTETSELNLRRRYWTVFQPNVLAAVRQGSNIPEWILESSTDGNNSAPTHIPDRKYTAFIAAISALGTAIIMIAVLIGARLLHF